MEKTFIKLLTTDLKGKGLTITDKAVYSSLYTKYQYHNNNEFYTYETFIAEELEISERSVRNSIKKLEELGLVQISRRYNNEIKKTTNYYRVNNPDTAQIQAAEEDKNTSTVNVPSEVKEQPTTKSFHLPLNYNSYDLTPNEKIRKAIEENYNETPNEYFSYINILTDIHYSVLEDLSNKSGTNPQLVLDYIKEIRNIA